MVDDRPEENGSLPDPERPKRAPPTIDLEATEVSSAPPDVAGDPPPEAASDSAMSARRSRADGSSRA